MKINETVKLLQDLIEIQSYSGEEKQALDFLVNLFEKFNWRSEIIPNPNSIQNYLILVSFGQPEIIFTTHVDVVPAKSEQFQARIINDQIFGRGANDAKGILVSMIAACRQLELAGMNNFGLLVVFEEETSSAGSELAGRVLKNRGIKYLVNGEPTEGKLAVGHKGIVSFTLTCVGLNAHSGYPELGVDANRQLIEIANELYQADFGSDLNLGPTTINLGVIAGGTAHNIIADQAELQAIIRVATSAEVVQHQIIKIVGSRGKLKFHNIQNPISLNVLDGFETMSVAYYTDLPNLLMLGAKGFLYGPGNISRAHTDQEFIYISEIEQAILDYQKIYQQLSDVR